jgi:hypothetical protein
MNLNQLIEDEISSARVKYGAFNSTHEAYAVLLEEVEELWEVVKTNTERHYGTPEWKSKALIPELIQISAVAKRIALELSNNEIKHV